MPRFTSAPVAVLIATTIAVPCVAQTPKPTTPPITLESMLQRLPESRRLVMTVDADKIKLPKGVTVAEIPATLPGTVAAFHRSSRVFGSLVVIAPETMVLLGVPPEDVSPWSGLPPGDAAKLLVASLTQDQWQAFVSEDGLPLSSLNGTDQQNLLKVIFPKSSLKVQYDVPNGPNRDEDIKEVGDELPQGRLRLGQTVMLGMPVAGKPDTHVFGMALSPKNAPHRYFCVDQSAFDADFVNGARVREVVKNTPKKGDLDFERAELAAHVDIGDIRTVADLVARIRKVSGVEVYADRRLETKLVTFTGMSEEVPASTLLRALAFCVTSTYRRVGTAYVLTDDILGIGTRKRRWSDFEQDATMMRQRALEDAGDRIADAHPDLQIPTYGELLAFSPAQRKRIAEERAKNSKEWEPGPSIERIESPLADLTPTQQDVARRTFDYYKRNKTSTLEGTIIVQAQAQIQLLLPSLDGPVTLNLETHNLFNTSFQHTQRKNGQAGPTFPPRATVARASGVPALNVTLGRFARRAVLALPTNNAEVDALLGSMVALKMNELWLPIRWRGRDLAAENQKEGNATDLPNEDVFRYAMGKAQENGIGVYVVIDPYHGRHDSTPREVRDLTILGETTDQIRSSSWVPAPDGTMTFVPRKATLPKDNDVVYLSPTNPAVTEKLVGLLKPFAGHKRLAGVVFAEAAPPGYAFSDKTIFNEEPSSTYYGYTEPMRLAFLRTHHADPIDIYPNEYRNGRANVTLPFFDDFNAERKLNQRWRAYRRDANIEVLRNLRKRIEATAPPGFNFILQTQSSEGVSETFGSWDNMIGLPPQDTRPTYTELSDSERAATQPTRNYIRIRVSESRYSGEISTNISAWLKQRPFNGIILDTIWNLEYLPPGTKPKDKLKQLLSH